MIEQQASEQFQQEQEQLLREFFEAADRLPDPDFFQLRRLEAEFRRRGLRNFRG
jgi:hypothetical protein